MLNSVRKPQGWLLLAALLAVGPVSAAQDTTKAGTETGNKTQYMKLPALLGLQQGTAPSDVIALIKQEFGDVKSSGAAKHLETKQLRPLSVRQAAVQALAKNPGVVLRELRWE